MGLDKAHSPETGDYIFQLLLPSDQNRAIRWERLGSNDNIIIITSTLLVRRGQVMVMPSAMNCSLASPDRSVQCCFDWEVTRRSGWISKPCHTRQSH